MCSILGVMDVRLKLWVCSIVGVLDVKFETVGA